MAVLSKVTLSSTNHAHHNHARPLTGARHPHIPRCPSRPASAARGLDGRRAASPHGRLCSHERTQTTAIVSDHDRDSDSDTSNLGSSARWTYLEGSSLLDEKALPVDGAVDDETVGQTSAENSLRLGVARVIWKAVLYHIDLFESSYIQTRRRLGGSPSCLVALMVLDFGRVINLT
jgi:hypothetical protein